MHMSQGFLSNQDWKLSANVTQGEISISILCTDPLFVQNLAH